MTIDVKNLMNKIINDSIDKRASDIHIYPDKSGNSFIKLRVNGHLSKYEKFSNRELEAVISLLKFNSNIDISRNKEPQSGRFVYNYNEKDYFLRVSTLPLSELNEGCVVRIFINELEDVDYSIFEEDSKYINDLSKKAYGLVLFSGPTGSGKSTSMYKLANELASKDKQVITVEDPVEKHISSLIQMQVNEKAGINYDNALKSILRCDPDAMVIGEIRDYKTASQVVTSSFSGHLVLSTIHAENSIGVINRLRDLNLSLEDIKQTIICIISQRLVNLTNGKRGLVTEILKKEDIHEYIDNNKIVGVSLEQKFELACEKGLITTDEKEKWGY
ncbi:competence type IV pilus ATPase ComGA [uncultured Gemella sp.]|uniref:competence type IV pilus ATPase ComGA n=1 Tax=uncultured Gemella sp. TaxID=254352 RepID=UPI0028D4B5E6|nr:competence type IV pilus ATPase ComGA [uncultured Gemella sp.]